MSADDPLFEGERRLAGVETADCTMVKVVNVAARTYLLVQSRFQDVFAFERISKKPLKFQLTGRLESPSAVLNLSDQAWPCFCDWDSDGDMDLLVGHGYGWPRILINRGTRKKPVYAEAKEILADGKPIRLLRNEILGEPGNWHNMGYSYPDFVDWDGDGLKDLMLPNETNRLYWYRNVGSAQVPRFAKRRQIICDGYPDNAKMRAESQRRANDPKSNNGVYPLEKERPFFWRTGVAFADFNADGLMDLITLDGFKRQATLFSRYRTAAGQLRLRRDSILKLKDGRPIDDRIVARGAHWGESFRAIDWDKDGRIDLLYSVAGSHHGTKDGTSIYLLRNVGTKARPVFEKPQSMKCFGEPIKITNHGPHPWPTDFDGDGTPDIVACVEWSVYPYYCHAALMMKERPKYTLELLQ